MIIARQMLITKAQEGLEQARISVALLADLIGIAGAKDVAAAISRIEAGLHDLRFLPTVHPEIWD